VQAVAIQDWIHRVGDYYDHTDIFGLFTTYAVGVVLVIGVLGIIYGRFIRRNQQFNTLVALGDFGNAVLMAHATILFGCAVFGNFVLMQKLSLGMGIAAVLAWCNCWQYFKTIGKILETDQGPPTTVTRVGSGSRRR
jgi:hypothetical protein